MQFNLYLLVLVLGVATGCQTGKDEKPLSTLSVHMEVGPNETSQNSPVPVYRAHPVMVNVDKVPILTEHDLIGARLVDISGGFVFRLEFDTHGMLVLEQYSVGNPGKHFAIYSAFGTKTNAQERWLAAPLIPRHIANGVLTFTPDADRADAELIIQGLTNMVEKIKKDE